VNFVSKDNAFSYKEKGIQVMDLAYMEMPKEREKYNLSKISGSIGLIARRFKTKALSNNLPLCNSVSPLCNSV